MCSMRYVCMAVAVAVAVAVCGHGGVAVLSACVVPPHALPASYRDSPSS